MAKTGPIESPEIVAIRAEIAVLEAKGVAGTITGEEHQRLGALNTQLEEIAAEATADGAPTA